MRKFLLATAVAISLACLMPATAALAVEDVQGTPAVQEAPAVQETPAVQDTPAVQEAPEAPGRRGMAMHRIGLGVNYWKALKNLDQEVHSDGFSYLASYQYAPLWFLRIGTNLEYFPSLGTSSHPYLAPELYLTAGGLVYVGAGIGIYYHDGDWGSAPFYMLRAGLDFPIAPRLFLDININYRFNDWKTLNFGDDLTTDTLRLGAALRFAL